MLRMIHVYFGNDINGRIQFIVSTGHANYTTRCDNVCIPGPDVITAVNEAVIMDRCMWNWVAHPTHEIGLVFITWKLQQIFHVKAKHIFENICTGLIWLHWMEFLPTVTDKYCLLYIKVYSVFYKLRFQIFAERSPEIECPEPRLTKLFDPEPVKFSDFCCISFCLNNGTFVTIIKKLLQFCRNYLGLVQFDNSFHVSWLRADANLNTTHGEWALNNINALGSQIEQFEITCKVSNKVFTQQPMPVPLWLPTTVTDY